MFGLYEDYLSTFHCMALWATWNWALSCSNMMLSLILPWCAFLDFAHCTHYGTILNVPVIVTCSAHACAHVCVCVCECACMCVIGDMRPSGKTPCDVQDSIWLHAHARRTVWYLSSCTAFSTHAVCSRLVTVWACSSLGMFVIHCLPVQNIWSQLIYVQHFNSTHQLMNVSHLVYIFKLHYSVIHVSY
jgi:hypothetical protein